MEESAVWIWIGATIIVAVTVVVFVGCAQPPPGIEDKIDRDALGSFREGGHKG